LKTEDCGLTTHTWTTDMALLKRLRTLIKREELENGLDEELKFHVEMKTRENVEAGMSPEEARSAALRQFGNVMRTRESTRAAWTLPRLESILQDIRYGLRQLRRNPGFTAVAVLTLALGIGANTTIFSVVSAFLLRKPPVPDPDRVVELVSKNPKPVWAAEISDVSAPDFADWRKQSGSYSALAASVWEEFTLSGGTAPERIPGLRVTADYFRVLGVEPLLGRTFAPGDDEAGHDRVVILSEGLWRREFGANDAVVGRTVRINGGPCTVIGVMPSSFHLETFGEQLWAPLVFTAEQLGEAGRGKRTLDVIARLRPGVKVRQAGAELATIASRLAQTRADADKGWGANVLTFQEYEIELMNARTAVVFLMATVGFVLLIACANLANLQLARNSSRLREFTVRAALGATRLRLARQLLSECLLIGLGGGGLGLLFAACGLRVLRARLNWSEYAVGMAKGISMDGPVLFFTLAVSIGAALVFGLAPALQISRPDLNSGLKESARSTTGGRERHRLQSLLVIGELALSLVLLVGAGLFMKAFIEEIQTGLGFDPHNTLTASVTLSGAAYKDAAHQAAFFEAVLRNLRSFPEVRAAAVTTSLPYTFPWSARFILENQPTLKPEEQPAAGYFAVSLQYFSAAGIPLQEGREFTPSDDGTSAPVVVINEAFAGKYFPNGDSLGRRICINCDASSNPKWSQIVGVVGNVSEFTGQTPPRPHIFVPYLQQPSDSMNLVVRVESRPEAFAASLRRAVWTVDKDQAVTSLRTMDRVVLDSRQGDDLMAEMMSAFAGIALAMAAIGIYGLLAYLVGQRTHEIGIRMALGARRGEILRMVIRNAMTLVITGIAIGFAASLALPNLFAASFTGYHVRSAWILMGTPVVVMVVALVSCAIPARRASKVDPLMALRYE
jgi:putative ABC transport system permease protein